MKLNMVNILAMMSYRSNVHTVTYINLKPNSHIVCNIRSVNTLLIVYIKH